MQRQQQLCTAQFRHQCDDAHVSIKFRTPFRVGRDRSRDLKDLSATQQLIFMVEYCRSQVRMALYRGAQVSLDSTWGPSASCRKALPLATIACIFWYVTNSRHTNISISLCLHAPVSSIRHGKRAKVWRQCIDHQYKATCESATKQCGHCAVTEV